MTDLLGILLADRFDIQSVLGRGGSATVYRAHDRVLDRSVAVKLLHEDASSTDDQARFDREIRLTARLVHPGIVPLFDTGTTGDQRFYVMPCIEAKTMRHQIAERAPTELRHALRQVSDIAEALSYAHSMSVVHRDIKPENVFCSDGRALVADFGIARRVDSYGQPSATTAALTDLGVVLGTVAYMSPEQAFGERDIDGRSDLYALACVMIELLSGAPPFTGSTPMAVLAQHLSTVPRVSDLLPGYPPELIDLLTRMLNKKPERRPASAAVVIEELRAIDGGLSGARAAEKRAFGSSSATPVHPPVATESERLAAEARALFNRAVQGGEGARGMVDMALVYAEKAVALDALNARALIVLSDVAHVRGFRGFDEEKASFERARALRLRALAIDDTISELHSSLGVMALYWEDDFQRAGTHLRRAVELATFDGGAHRHYGCWLKMSGQFDLALEHVRRAEELTPDAPHIKVAVADVLIALGRYVEAITPLQAALRQTPTYEQATERLEMACHRSGRFDDAFAARRTLLGTRRQFDRLRRLTDNFDSIGWEATREEDLRAELTDLLARSVTEDPFKDPQGSRQLSDRLIIAYGEIGEWNRAMDWVERGYYLRPGRLIRVLTDLPFDRRGLAVDRRYARLLRTAGLESML